MSLNRPLLSKITKDLENKKKPSKPYVPRNQWQHPGEVTTIPSNNITMKGVSYPVLGVPDVGPSQMMYPDQDYRFPGARNVMEYPMMQAGGTAYADNTRVGNVPRYSKLSNFTGYQPDTVAENIFEIVDPSGISSWDDVYRSAIDSGMSWQTALEVLGAVPMLGKFAKLSSPGIHLTKYKGLDRSLFNALPKNKAVSNGISTAAKVGRASDAYQAYDQYEEGGDMIRRADGSYSKRGLWDNIRANRGSGKKPTKEMLEQERKIKSEMKTGGSTNSGNAWYGMGGQIIYQDGGFVDLKKQYNLEPLSKMGIEKAKELAAKNPNLKFVCTAEGCAQIAADAAQAYGQDFSRSHAWNIGNKNNVEFVNPTYVPYMDSDQPLPDPKNFKVLKEVMEASGKMVGMNRKNNLYDKDHKKLKISGDTIPKGLATTTEEANDSFDYANRALYPNSRLYEHMGYMVDKGRLLHGTGANKEHPAFYTIDNLSDGISLPGYGQYEAVETISPSSNWQKVLNKVGLRKKGGSTYSGGVWYQVGGINPTQFQITDETQLQANAEMQMADQIQDPVKQAQVKVPALTSQQKFDFKVGSIYNNMAADMLNPYSLTNGINTAANFIEGFDNQSKYRDELNRRRQNYSTDQAFQAQGSTDLSRGTHNMYNQFLPNQQGGNLSFAGMNQKYRQQGGEIDTNNLNMSVISSDLSPVPSPFINLDMPVFDMPAMPEGVTAKPNMSVSDSTTDEIVAQESGGNYKAYNPKGGGEGAVGKYQFRWTTHKGWIQDLTGVKSKEEFMNNPEAQEMAYTEWDRNTLTPQAIRIKEKYGLNIPLGEIKKQIHFSGAQGAEDYYAYGKETRDANGTTNSTYGKKKRAKVGGVMEISHTELLDLLANGGQVEFL